MTPGTLSLYAGPDGTECKALHCGKRVGEGERGEKDTRRKQLCMEVDREMQNSGGVFTRRTGGNLSKSCTKRHLQGLEMT